MVFRIILKTTSSHDYSQNKESKSDSQKSKYQETINDILEDENMFENFRRNYRYREILEHVSYTLGKKYLNQINSRSNRIKFNLDWDTIKLNDSVGKPVLFPTLGNSDSKSWDLVISNYAFSELPYLVQEHYIKNVILKSKNGFMIMNSGRTNITGRSTGKHSVSDLLRIIPNSRICEEAPLTGPDNFIIIWGNAS